MSHIRPLISICSGIAIGALLFTTLFGAGLGAAPLALRPETVEGATDCDAGRSVQVSGAATINVVPDRVLVKLGVQTNGATPDGVLEENMAAIQRVIDAVRKVGVAPEDISTDYYIVYPVYSDYDSLHIKGYRLDNVVAVTLRDANQTGNLLVAALKAGANEVVDVQFYTSELRRYRDEARALALTAAQEKAQALAETSGAAAGCLLRVDENSSSYYTGYWWGWSGRNSGLMSQNVVQNAAPTGSDAASDGGPVSLGRIAVRAEVNASYALK